MQWPRPDLDQFGILLEYCAASMLKGASVEAEY